MKFRFIAAEKASFPIRLLCRTLHVSRAGFYAWQAAPRRPGRKPTNGSVSRSRRSTRRRANATAVRGFTRSCGSVDAGRGASAWRG